MAACPAVHVAFYLWYATPAHDGRWGHWDHAVLPHWSAETRARFPPHGTPWRPPDEPHSPFYPERGLYSSRDGAALAAQMEELAAAGVDSIMLSWWGRRDADVQRDSQGANTDEAVPAVLAAAHAAGVGVSWHLEPYGGRTPRTVAADLAYLHETYGGHPAVYRQPHRGRKLPLGKAIRGLELRGPTRGLGRRGARSTRRPRRRAVCPPPALLAPRPTGRGARCTQSHLTSPLAYHPHLYLTSPLPYLTFSLPHLYLAPPLP